jgi:hypothetical protein
MKLNIRRQYTARGILYLAVLTYILVTLFIAFPVSLLLDSSGEKSGIYVFIGTSIWALWMGWYVVRHLIRNSSLKKRNQALLIKSSEYGMQPAKIPMSSSMISVGGNGVSNRGHTVTHSYVGADWGYGEYQFKSYVETKRGRKYDTATIYYAVAMFTLPRKLPNVFFDSHKTGGKEFSVLFDAAQKHSLESVFDDYFTTYFHEDYKIDSLSFITPEVMEVLIAAQEYDIEIYQDKLYIYNELENMPQQLENMWRSGDRIRQKLLNNILSYRDERIDFADGRKTVSTLGLTLQRSPTPLYMAIAFGAIMALTTFISAFFYIDFEIFLKVYAWTGPGGLLMVVVGIKQLKTRKKERREASARSHIAA